MTFQQDEGSSKIYILKTSEKEIDTPPKKAVAYWLSTTPKGTSQEGTNQPRWNTSYRSSQENWGTSNNSRNGNNHNNWGTSQFSSFYTRENNSSSKDSCTNYSSNYSNNIGNTSSWNAKITTQKKEAESLTKTWGK